MEKRVGRRFRLKAAFVNRVKEPGKYYDGSGYGLFLQVFPTGAKCWQQCITIKGRRRTLGLGGHREVTLAAARAKAIENWKLVRRGEDPRPVKHPPPESRAPTFAQAAAIVVERLRPSWTNPREADIWLSSLNRFAFPSLGSLPISDIEPRDVLAVLEPIWIQKSATARKLRNRIGAVMKWAVAEGYRTDNPAGDVISGALPRRKKEEHHRAVPHAEVGGVVAMVRVSDALPSTTAAFTFLVLTAARSGEVRGARWSEFDFKAATWTIPPARMKSRVEHRVPLSSPALAVLHEAKGFRGVSGLVFPSKTGRPLSDATLSKLLRGLNVKAVPHGFRSSFRDWCGETGVAREVAEACLAHTIGSKVEQAYARSDLFKRRTIVMEAWGDYVARGAAGISTISSPR